MHQDLADLDALAAGPQCILHAFPAADDGHPTQAPRKVHTHVLLPCWGHDSTLLEGQVPQPSLHDLQYSPHVLLQYSLMETLQYGRVGLVWRIPEAVLQIKAAGMTSRKRAAHEHWVHDKRKEGGWGRFQMLARPEKHPAY